MCELYHKLSNLKDIIDEKEYREYFGYSDGIIYVRGNPYPTKITNKKTHFCGILHKKLPDVEYIGFYDDGVLHNIGQPAKYIFDTDTKKLLNSFWYMNGKCASYTKWAKDNGIVLSNMTEEDKILIRMKWGN